MTHEKFGGQTFFLGFDAFKVGDDALGHKVQPGLQHHAMLFRPFFRGEDFVGTHIADEEFTAGDGFGGIGVGRLGAAVGCLRQIVVSRSSKNSKEKR